jgi:exo-1,4-beta-D-glucosaminidase
MRIKIAFTLMSGLVAWLFLPSCSRTEQTLTGKILLNGDWRIQQAGRINNVPGSVVSGSVISIDSWYPATVPSTVMGILTANGLYPDIFMADSLKRVDRRQFEKPWWYRTEFKVPALKKNQHVVLNFDGINYAANVWLNSTLIASRDSVYGTFRRFEFDITRHIKDSINILAVELFKQQPGDLAHGFVDWNPAPPDDNLGLWREVYLQITGDVAVKNTFVLSDVNTQTLDEASLTITADVVNYAQGAVNGRLTGKIEDIEFSVPVRLKAGETKQVRITPDDVEALRISNPRLWWCNNLGEPNLYKLDIQYVSNDMISDSRQITFGIREIETYFNKEGHKGFKLNGKEVLIKAGGWVDDLFFRDTKERDEIQVQYVKHMNLNAIRLENIWGNSQSLYDLCDEYGIMIMVGWSCQWEWENYLGKPCDEFGGIKTPEDMDLIVESLRHQIRYLQNHPSVIVWVMGSDMTPRPVLEQRYHDLIASIDNRPYLAAASSRNSKISGPTGMKMNGPYNYVGPSYWYIDSVNGGAYGFNTETGPGPQIPVMETFLRMIPENKKWPINDTWNYHCNPSESFGNLDIFNNVLYQRYGWPANLENYMLKANVQSYEAMKGMFEAFRANRPNTTGIVQWMLNSAWPSFYWQLYDYYLLPTSAYYAARKANAPEQLIYNYGNNCIYAVNEKLTGLEKAKARIRMLDLQGRTILSEELIMDLEGDTSFRIYKLPPIRGNVFLALSLLDDQNAVIADNFYWLSGKPDVYDWEKTEWYYTPLKSSADFKQLNYLVPAEVDVLEKHSKEGDGWLLETTVTNKSNRIAFFMNITLKDANQRTIFPVFWDDNYVSLLPGETRTLRCKVPASLSIGEGCTFNLSGWNIREQQIPIAL